MKYKKRINRRRAKKQNIIIICSFVTVLLCLSFGYAAFSTNINVVVRGNIYKASDKCYTTSDNGDGTLTITNYDAGCGSEVSIPSTIKGKVITKIGGNNWDSNSSFAYKGLTKVVIPDTVVSIGLNSFRSNNIVSLDLGNFVQKIGWEAFLGNKLTNIVLPSSLTEVGPEVFEENKLTSIPSLEYINTLGRGAFTGNLVKGDGRFVYQKNGDITDYTTLNSYAGDWISELIIPANVKTLVYYSLRFTRAEVVTLSDGLETIEDFAFTQSYATTVNIPSTIKTIGPSVFSQSVAVKTINIDRKENAISGAPWEAKNATVNWIGDN